MTLLEFVAKYTGQGIDYDQAYGNLNTPVFNLGIFPGFNRFLKVIKPTKKKLSIINFNFSRPFFTRLIPRNPIYSRFIINPYSTISKIGCIGTYSQIFSTIIKGISIN